MKFKSLNASHFNPLNPELNPICYLLALLAHHFLHVSRIMVKSLTLRLLMSYIYGAHILDVSRSHSTTQHSRQDSSGRAISSSQRPLPDNTRHSQQTNIHAPGQESYRLCCVVVCDLETSRICAPYIYIYTHIYIYIYDISGLRVKKDVPLRPIVP